MAIDVSNTDVDVNKYVNVDKDVFAPKFVDVDTDIASHNRTDINSHNDTDINSHNYDTNNFQPANSFNPTTNNTVDNASLQNYNTGNPPTLSVAGLDQDINFFKSQHAEVGGHFGDGVSNINSQAGNFNSASASTTINVGYASIGASTPSQGGGGWNR